MLRTKSLVILLVVLALVLLVGAVLFGTTQTDNSTGQTDPPPRDMNSASESPDNAEIPQPDEPNQAEQQNEDEMVACTMDAKQCPDGSFVGRVAPDCEFAACPSETNNGDDWPIRYGEDVSRMEEFRQDCEQKSGVFNECGSACPPDAEVCMDVCSMLCEKPTGTEPVTQAQIECSDESRNVDACIEIYQPVCGLTQVECFTEPCDPVPQTYSNNCFACQNDRVISYSEGACEADA